MNDENGGGLTKICIIFNEFGKESINYLQNYCQKAKGVNSLKALHLKNPNPVSS